MDLEIKKAQLEHMSQIFDIEKNSFITYWSYDSLYNDIFHTPISYYLVAEQQGVVLGYIGMWHVMDEAHILTLAVASEHRRKGIASALLSGLILFCEQNGIKRMTLEVREHNDEALSLYKKFGFVEAGIRKQYYQDTNENAVIMWKEL